MAIRERVTEAVVRESRYISSGREIGVEHGRINPPY